MNRIQPAYNSLSIVVLCLGLLVAQPVLAQSIFTGKDWSEFAGDAQAVCADADIDNDNDGLIELCYLEDVGKIRHQPDGSGLNNGDGKGKITTGCGGTGCKGYELVRDLDFKKDDSYRNSKANKPRWTTSPGWESISSLASIFEGNGYTISHLRRVPDPNNPRSFDGLDSVHRPFGLFNTISTDGRVYNLGLLNIYIEITQPLAPVGGLAAKNHGVIYSCYVTGKLKVASHSNEFAVIGGLVGAVGEYSVFFKNEKFIATIRPEPNTGIRGIISNSYARIEIDRGNNNRPRVGALVGGSAGEISHSYAVGFGGSFALISDQFSGSTLKDSYLHITSGTQAVLVNNNDGTIERSYYNTANGDRDRNEQTSTPFQLQRRASQNSNPVLPYYLWFNNVWDFGFADQYPALKHAKSRYQNCFETAPLPILQPICANFKPIIITCGTSQQPRCGSLLPGQRPSGRMITSTTSEADEGEVIILGGNENLHQPNAISWRQASGPSIKLGDANQLGLVLKLTPYMVESGASAIIRFSRCNQLSSVRQSCRNYFLTVNKKDNGQAQLTARPEPGNRKKLIVTVAEDPDGGMDTDTIKYQWQASADNQESWYDAAGQSQKLTYQVPSETKTGVLFRLRVAYTDKQGYATTVHSAAVDINTPPQIRRVSYYSEQRGTPREGDTLVFEAKEGDIINNEDDPLTFEWTFHDPRFVPEKTTGRKVRFSSPKNLIRDNVNISVPNVATVTVSDGYLSTTKTAGLYLFKINNGRIILSTATQVAGSRRLEAPAVDPTLDPDNIESIKPRFLAYSWFRCLPTSDCSPNSGEWENLRVRQSHYTAPGNTMEGTLFRVRIFYVDSQGYRSDAAILGNPVGELFSKPVRYQAFNRAPTILGVAMTVNATEGSTITLDAHRTVDDDGDDTHNLLRYAWKQTAGAKTFTASTASKVSFKLLDSLASQNDTRTTLTFLLTVSDFYEDSTQQVVVFVNKVNNDIISLSADSARINQVGRVLIAPHIVLTDDSDSTTNTPGHINYYLWQRKEGANWINIEQAHTSTYTVPRTITSGKQYRVQALYTDGQGYATTVHSLPIDYRYHNTTPTIFIVNAGMTALSVYEGTSATLDASGSRDAENDPLTYQWSLPAGFSLIGPATDSQVSFYVPENLLSADREQQIRLASVTVGDGVFNATTKVAVLIIKKDNGQISLSPATQPDKKSRILAAPNVPWRDDPDDRAGTGGQITYYQWQICRKGGDCSPTSNRWQKIIGAGGAHADTYKVTGEVEDGTPLRVAVSYQDRQGYDKTVFSGSVEYRVFNRAPTISIVSEDIHTAEGNTVTLDASGSSDADEDDAHKLLRYAWKQTAGAKIFTDSQEAARVSFKLPDALLSKDDTRATLKFLLTVSDFYAASTRQVVVTVIKVNNDMISLSGDSARIDQAGRMLTAPRIVLTDDSDSTTGTPGRIIRYSWQRNDGSEATKNWVDIEQARASTYTLLHTVTDGKQYRVQIRYTDGQGYATTVHSLPISYRYYNTTPVIFIARVGTTAIAVYEGTTATLDASDSRDAENDPLIYQWSIPAELSLISTATDSKVSFYVPKDLLSEVVGQQIRIASVTVGDGAFTATTEITVLIIKRDNGQISLGRPVLKRVVIGGKNTRGLEAPNVDLVHDPDGSDATLQRYQWQQQIKGKWADIEGAGGTNADDYTIPSVTQRGAKFRLEVEYIDSQGYPTVVYSKEYTYPLVNQAPMISIEPVADDKHEGDTVVLDASKTKDIDRDDSEMPLRYAWQQTLGKEVLPRDAAISSTNLSFDLPYTLVAAASSRTELRFQLTVSDAHTSATQQVVVIVRKKDNSQIVALMEGHDKPFQVTDTRVLRAPAFDVSPDEDSTAEHPGAILGYQWRRNDGTEEVNNWVDIETAQSSTYTVPGTIGDAKQYRVAITYQDGQGHQVTLISNPVKYHLVNTTPTILDVPSVVQTTEGKTVTLDASATHDADGDRLSFSWQQTAGPYALAGKTTTGRILAFTLATTFAEASATTELKFALTVSDAHSSVTQQVTVQVYKSNNGDIEPTVTQTGRVLTAQFDLLTDPDSTTATSGTLDRYQWQRQESENWIDIDGANGKEASRYTVSADVEDKTKFRVQVAYTDGQGYATTVHSAAIAYNLANTTPTIAGVPSVVQTTEGKTVTLDASAASDEDGDALSFSWQQIGGKNVLIRGTAIDDEILTFSLPYTLVAAASSRTELRFQLMVSDAHTSVTQQVVVIVSKKDNSQIVALAEGYDKPLQVTDTRVLRAPAFDISLDEDSTVEHPGAILGYQWRRNDGTKEANNWVSIDTTQSSTYTVPGTIGDAKQYRVAITYQDGQGHQVTLVSNPINYRLVNTTPTILGVPSVVQTTEGKTVTLDAGATRDVDGDMLSFSWQQIDGKDVLIRGTAINDEVLTYELPDTLVAAASSRTELRFQLTVSDAHSSTTQQVTVQVYKSNNGDIERPTLIQTARVLTAQLDLLTDPDSTAATSGTLDRYQWQQQENESWVYIEGASGKEASRYTVLDDVEDKAKFRVQVAYTDGQGYATTVHSAAIAYRLANTTPTIVGVPSMVQTTEGKTVTLDASAASDADGDRLSFSWQQISGKNVLIRGTTINDEVLMFKLPYTLVAAASSRTELRFQLMVNDAHTSATQQVVVIVSKKDNSRIMALAESYDKPLQVTGTRVLRAPAFDVSPDEDSTAEHPGAIMSYQWRRNDGTETTENWVDIEAARASTYTVPGTMGEDKQYQVAIIYQDGQGHQVTLVSNPISYRLVNTTPTILGVPNVVQTTEDKTVTLDASATRDADGDMLSFSWYQTAGPDILAGKTITGRTLTFAPITTFVEVGATTELKFTLTVSDAHTSATQQVAVQVNKSNNGDIERPTLIQTARVLTAQLDLLTDPDSTAATSGTLNHYQWQRQESESWVDIEGASSKEANRYIVSDDVADKTKFRVQVAYTDGQGYATTITSGILEYKSTVVITGDALKDVPTFDKNRWSQFPGGAKAVCSDSDIDNDDDGLIELCYLEDIEAIRYAPEGSGLRRSSDNSRIRTGCAGGIDCSGYELVRDLDFAKDDSYRDAATHKNRWNEGGEGWTKIDLLMSVLEGNGHTVSNMLIAADSAGKVAFVDELSSSGIIRNLGLLAVRVAASTASEIALLVLQNTGTILNSFVQGELSLVEAPPRGSAFLVGENRGLISNSYVHLSSSGYTDGTLAIENLAGATIHNSYVVGELTTNNVVASFLGSGGNLGTVKNIYHAVRTLASDAYPIAVRNDSQEQMSSGTIVHSYWDSDLWGGSRSEAAPVGGTIIYSQGFSTTQLQTPIAAGTTQTEPYYLWHQSDWHFGTEMQYPALRYTRGRDGSQAACGISQQPLCEDLLIGQHVRRVVISTDSMTRIDAVEGEVFLLNAKRAEENLSYVWTQVAGTTLTVSTTNTAILQFSLPADWVAREAQQATLTWSLVVRSDRGDVSTQTVEVVVTKIDNDDISLGAITRAGLQLSFARVNLQSDADGVGALGENYQWQICRNQDCREGTDWADIGGVRGTGTSLTLLSTNDTHNEASDGNRFRVKVTYRDGQGYEELVVSKELIYTFGNNRPEIRAPLDNASIMVKAGREQTINVTVVDEDIADLLTVSLTAVEQAQQFFEVVTQEVQLGANGFATRDPKGLKIRGLLAGTTTASLVVTDGTTASEAISLMVKVLANTTPTISGLGSASSGITMLLGRDTIRQFTVTLDDEDEDGDKDRLIASGRSSKPSVVVATFSGTGLSRQLRIEPISAGTATITVAISDRRGVQNSIATVSFEVTVIADQINNQAPVIATLAPLSATEGQSLNIDVTDKVSDPNSDALSYAWRVLTGDKPSSLLAGQATNAATLTLTVPTNWIEGAEAKRTTVTLQLTVSDATTETATTLMVTIIKTNNGSLNRAAAPTRNGMTLTAPMLTLTDDPDSTATAPGSIISYQWQQCTSADCSTTSSWSNVTEEVSTTSFTVPSHLMRADSQFRVLIKYKDGQGYDERLTSEALDSSQAELRMRLRIFLEGALQ